MQQEPPKQMMQNRDSTFPVILRNLQLAGLCSQVQLEVRTFSEGEH